MMFNRKGASFGTIVAVFGSILIALGVAWLIAQNWHQIPSPIKIIILLAATSGAFFAGTVMRVKNYSGIGKALLDEALQRARNLGFPAVVVVGQPEYYARVGFLPGARWQLQCTPSVAAEVLTAMELVDGGLQTGGRIIYPPLFTAIF